MVTLQTNYTEFSNATTKLLALSNQSRSLDLLYQKLIAETLMLRLFYELDDCIEGIILKLVRGAPYLDGTKPLLLRAPFKSTDAARQHIIKAHKVYYLDWTTLAKTTKYLGGIIDPSDHFLTTRTLHDSIYEDMRNVRNHVAHNTQSTKNKFSPIVKRLYAGTSGISAAKFLLSARAAVTGYAGSEIVLAQYVRWARVFIKTATKAT